MTSCDVAVIGGGVIGVSVAYHLASAGCERVVVLEQGQVGSGSSLRAAGGVRRQFTTAGNIAWSRAAHARFTTFEDEFGADPVFRRCGYLLLASSEASEALLRDAVARQQDAAVPVRMLEPAALEARFPALSPAGVRIAALTPDDGYVDVQQVLAAVARRARTAGAVIREGSGVRDIRIGRGRVGSVLTDDGPLAAGAIVLAAGAWSPRLGRIAGIHVPIAPARREMWRLGPLDAARLPWTMDLDGGFYFRPDGDGIAVSGDLTSGVGLATDVGPGLAPPIRAALARRLPAARDAPARGAWAGTIEATPDGGALVGPHPHVDGLWLACGFSGHGFMHGLVAGAVVSEWLLQGRASTVDPGPFRLSRFDEGDADHELLHLRPIAA
jgi:sarcosine oxidase subunit beta